MFYLPVSLCITCMPNAHGGQKRALELELQAVVSHHVSALSQSHLSSLGSCLLSHKTSLDAGGWKEPGANSTPDINTIGHGAEM